MLRRAAASLAARHHGWSVDNFRAGGIFGAKQSHGGQSANMLGPESMEIYHTASSTCAWGQERHFFSNNPASMPLTNTQQQRTHSDMPAPFIQLQRHQTAHTNGAKESWTSRHSTQLDLRRSSHSSGRNHLGIVQRTSSSAEQLDQSGLRNDNNSHQQLPQPGSSPISVVLAPEQIYQKAVAMGESKAEGALSKAFLSSVLAGAYVGFGGMLALSIGANCPGLAASDPGLQKMVMGAFGLPVGLLMVLVCGAELFTSNTAMLPVAVYEGRAKVAQLIRNWSVSYSGNLVGALMLVGIATLGGVFAAAPDGAINVAAYKTSHTFIEAFGRGVLCNWLVCLAVWQATAAQTLGGKAIAVWFPISAFVAMGLEISFYIMLSLAQHSVANMFIIPMGMAAGADVSVSKFLFSNLLPVTLGNIVAGSLFVATSYACIYGKLLSKIAKRL